MPVSIPSVNDVICVSCVLVERYAKWNMKQLNFGLCFTFVKLIQAYWEHSLSGWYTRFLEDIEYVEDEQCSGRPSTSKTDENIERVNLPSF